MINALVVWKNYLVVGGWFSAFSNGTSAKAIAYYNGYDWFTFPNDNTNNGINGLVYSFAVFNNKLVIGGTFNSLGNTSVTVRNIVIYDNSNGISTWTVLPCGTNNGLNGAVNSMVSFHNKLYIGGSFTALSNNTVALKLAVYDPNTLTWDNWPIGNSFGVNAGVNRLYAPSEWSDNIHIGGGFTGANDGTTQFGYSVIVSY